jgi:hypothetical protein
VPYEVEVEDIVLNKTLIVLVAALLASGALAIPCSAGTTFSFQYSLPATDPTMDSVSASGTMSADGVAGGYIITGIEGTRIVNGITEVINGLIAPGLFFGNTNMLFYPNAPLLDSDGLSFTTSGAGDDGFGNVNLYSLAGGDFTEVGATIGSGTFSVAEIPEPSTLVLLALGAAALGARTRIRRN